MQPSLFIYFYPNFFTTYTQDSLQVSEDLFEDEAQIAEKPAASLIFVKNVSETIESRRFNRKIEVK